MRKGCEVTVILVSPEDPQLNAAKMSREDVIDAINQMDRERLDAYLSECY
jgi:hypothetical protein